MSEDGSLLPDPMEDPQVAAAHKHERFRGEYPIVVEGLVNRFGNISICKQERNL